MQVNISIIISIIALFCTTLGVVIGFFTFTRNRDKDVKSDASELAIIRTKLDSINQGVENIRIDIKVEQKERLGLSERLIRLEESHKSLHKRLDDLEEMIDEYCLMIKNK